MEQDIQDIKERLIRLESKVDLLVSQQVEVKERPLWLTFIIGFVVVFFSIHLLSALMFGISRLYSVIF